MYPEVVTLWVYKHGFVRYVDFQWARCAAEQVGSMADKNLAVYKGGVGKHLSVNMLRDPASLRNTLLV